MKKGATAATAVVIILLGLLVAAVIFVVKLPRTWPDTSVNPNAPENVPNANPAKETEAERILAAGGSFLDKGARLLETFNAGRNKVAAITAKSSAISVGTR